MRSTVALCTLLALSGCDSAPESITAATVTAVTVEALPLGTAWDDDGSGPEVVVQIQTVDRTSIARPPLDNLTEVAQNVTAGSLPLRLEARPGVFETRIRRFPLDRSIAVSVLDGDTETLYRSQLMFASDTLRIESLLGGGESVGDERTVTVEGGETRVRVHLRWE